MAFIPSADHIVKKQVALRGLGHVLGEPLPRQLVDDRHDTIGDGAGRSRADVDRHAAGRIHHISLSGLWRKHGASVVTSGDSTARIGEI